MRRPRFSETQIVGILNEADSGVAVKEVCQKHGISDATYYQWKSKFGGLEASDVRRMRELKAENSQFVSLRLLSNSLIVSQQSESLHHRLNDKLIVEDMDPMATMIL